MTSQSLNNCIVDLSIKIQSKCVKKTNFINALESLQASEYTLKLDILTKNNELADHMVAMSNIKKIEPKIDVNQELLVKISELYKQKFANHLELSLEGLKLKHNQTQTNIKDAELKLKELSDNIILLEQEHERLNELKFKCEKEYNNIIERSRDRFIEYINDIKLNQSIYINDNNIIYTKELTRMATIVSNLIINNVHKYTVEMVIDWVLKEYSNYLLHYMVFLLYLHYY